MLEASMLIVDALVLAWLAVDHVVRRQAQAYVRALHDRELELRLHNMRPVQGREETR